MKKLICMLLAAVMLMACTPVMAGEGELTGLTSMELVSRMGIGWNLGNTFDATGGNTKDIYSQEKSWGNPQVNEDLIRRVKEAGFNTIRIPVTWYKHTSRDGKYTINPQFLARVKEVVDYAYAQDLYVILNMHHENWVNSSKLDKDYVAIGNRAYLMWKQIAAAFADYDQHLIFEGFNEPRMQGTNLEWNGNADTGMAVNYMNQCFVNAVRENPVGRNGERCLMIPTYAASCSAVNMNRLTLPVVNGEAASNLIVSIHCYSPYDFCLSDNWKTFDPNNNSHTSSIDTVFSDAQRYFIDKGIPVIIGETGATNTGNNTSEREKWAHYMGSKAAAYGIPIVIWDNGSHGTSNGERHAWIQRVPDSKLAAGQSPYVFPTVIEQLMAGAHSVEWGSGRDVHKTPASMLGGKVVFHNQEGLTNAKQWDSTFIQLAVQKSWFRGTSAIAVIYEGDGEPKVILDSEEKEQWWIPVDPERVTNLGDKKVAWFAAEDMLAECAKFGVTEAAQLRNLCIVATNGDITVFEMSYLGDANTSTTWKMLGNTQGLGVKQPSDPTFANMTFAGWYTTFDYKPGTEYMGYAANGPMYAKMIMNAQ